MPDHHGQALFKCTLMLNSESFIFVHVLNCFKMNRVILLKLHYENNIREISILKITSFCFHSVLSFIIRTFD